MILGSLQYFQVGLVSGGVSKCGDKSIPSYFTRLDHPDIADFIADPDMADPELVNIPSALGKKY